jgi:Flp pilus assembly protein TadG
MGDRVMGFSSILARILRRASSFGRANDGNVAMILALAALPLVMAIGMAIDYSRAVSARSAMQEAIDATSLMLAQDAANSTPAQLTTKAQNYFNALYSASSVTRVSGVTDVTVAATYTPNSGTGSTVLVTASGNVPTDFMMLAGVSQMAINTSSTAKWGNTKLRVALALDNTGSMAQNGKMTALQGGATNLIDTLSATATNQGDVYISIVPFANEVNMGESAFVNSGYIDWTNWSTFNSNLNNYTCGSSNSNRNHTMKCGTANNTTSNWNGCVMDRGNQSGPSATNDDATSVAPGTGTTMFPADQGIYCPQAVNVLSYDWTALKQVITNMSPNGNTNQAIGLQHAWMTLLQQAPYNAPAESANYHYVKAIVLFSDGLNTQDRWYTDATSIDNRQKLLCDNIKTTGVTIYSIQVNTSGDPQSSVLAYCAGNKPNGGDPTDFYYLTSSTQVLSTFQAISTKLSQLRIAQ